MPKALRISQLSIVGNILYFVHRNSLVIFLIMSVIILVAAKSNRNLDQYIHDKAIDAALPMFKIMQSPFEFVKLVSHNLHNIVFLSHENKLLKQDNQELRKKLLNLAYLEGENKELKKLLNFQEDLNNSDISARIYINSEKSFANLAVISKGEDIGIKKGQAVVTSKGLVGRVLKVSEHNSHIVLVTDNYSKIPVYSANSRERAILFGRGGAYPVLEYLDAKHKLEVGEIIYSSGDGLVYPANIPVGTVVKNNNGKMSVIPFVDFNKIDIVKIISAYK